MAKEQIIVIGAGAAGLMAARTLSSQYSVTILEAGNTPGGRMCTIQDMDGGYIEAGAEFVHGHLPLTLSLLHEAGLKYYPVEGEMYQVEDGQWTQEEEMDEGWNSLLEEMGDEEQDMPLQAFLDKYYPLPGNAALREHAKAFAQGFDLADTEKAGIKFLYQEWTNESEDNFRIEKGYSALVDFLAKGLDIRTNQCVKHIAWQAGNVVVMTASQTFRGSKVIVTVPLPVLQEDAITFSPAIDTYGEAARVIGWGSVIKIVLKFRYPFWQEKAENIGFILSSEKIPTWWPQLPDDMPALTGWLGGPPALALKDADDDVLLDLSFSSLAAIFNVSADYLREQLTDNHIFNWTAIPHIHGAYSYGTPGFLMAQKVLNTPVSDTVYFAGEALYNGKSPGTVEAAFSSGKAVAEKILSSSNV